MALVKAFGYRSVAAVVGHDVGSFVAAWCALIRPDVFRSVVLLSVPFTGPPSLPFNSANRSQDDEAAEDSANNMRAQLAALHSPRKFYQHYYASREANDNLHHPRQGLHDFLWGYFYLKSADWKGNKPIPLKTRPKPWPLWSANRSGIRTELHPRTTSSFGTETPVSCARVWKLFNKPLP